MLPFLLHLIAVSWNPASAVDQRTAQRGTSSCNSQFTLNCSSVQRLFVKTRNNSDQAILEFFQSTPCSSTPNSSSIVPCNTCFNLNFTSVYLTCVGNFILLLSSSNRDEPGAHGYCDFLCGIPTTCTSPAAFARCALHFGSFSCPD
jgi:hypothetical protein